MNSKIKFHRDTPTKKEEEKREVHSENTGGGLLLPTGNSLLNLALSRQVSGGYGSGRLVNAIGDSHTGKTILALTTLAEMANDHKWDDYDLCYYDSEFAQSFDIAKLFGSKLKERMQEAWLREVKMMNLGKTLDAYEPPHTIQDYYIRTLHKIKDEKPFVTILDSFDAITSDQEIKRAEDLRKNKQEKGSFKTEKPKIASEMFRVITKGLSNSQSLVIIISQTRDNIDPISMKKKERSGGRALTFYASHIYWLAKASSISKKVKIRGEERTIKTGAQIKAKIEKTKLTGWEGTIEFPIYRQIGVDDIGSSIDFLIKNSEHWKKDKGIYVVDSLRLQGAKSKLIQQIDYDKDLQQEIKKQLQEAWDSNERLSSIQRRCRFSED